MSKTKTRDTKPFALKIDTRTYNRFRSYADKLGQSYTLCLERILNEYLDNKGHHLDSDNNQGYGKSL